MLVDKPKKIDYFRKQIKEFGEKWKTWKTAYEAERKGKWQPSMGKTDNPLETIWTRSAGEGRFPFYGGDIRPVLGAYALLAVIHDKVLPNCPSIAKEVFPEQLVSKIWHNLVTGATLEHRIVIPDATYYPRRVIPILLIENFLRDVTADIESYFAPKTSTAQKSAAIGGKVDLPSERPAETERDATDAKVVKHWYKTVWAVIGGIILLLGGVLAVIQIRESDTFKKFVASWTKSQSASNQNAQTDSNATRQPSKPTRNTSKSLPDLNSPSP
jgi:hypothetical protein